MDGFDELIDEIAGLVLEELQRQARPGVYRAQVAAAESLRRAQIVPAWMERGAALPGALRVAPSIIDCIEAPGTTVAVIGEDGQPDRPMYLGAVCDDSGAPESKTAWLRAALGVPATDGHIELGATKGVRLFVGANGGGMVPREGAIVAKVGALEVRLLATGQVAAQNGTAELLGQVAAGLGAAKDLIDGFNLVAAAIDVAAGAAPAAFVTNASLAAFVNAGLDLATRTALAAAITAAVAALDTFVE